MNWVQCKHRQGVLRNYSLFYCLFFKSIDLIIYCNLVILPVRLIFSKFKHTLRELQLYVHTRVRVYIYIYIYIYKVASWRNSRLQKLYAMLLNIHHGSANTKAIRKELRLRYGSSEGSLWLFLSEENSWISWWDRNLENLGKVMIDSDSSKAIRSI